METMFSVDYHSDAKGFLTHGTVTPIRVIWRGLNPGATLETITYRDKNGKRYNASPNNYFATEAAAWKSLRKELRKGIANQKEIIKTEKTRLRAFQTVLRNLRTKFV